MRLVYVFAVTVLLLVGFGSMTTAAQSSAAASAPPIASLINITQPQADGIVTVTGSAGAVAGGAQVIVRNIYTGETVYTTAGFDGGFRATLYGPGTTPFWISTARSIEPQQRDLAGSLPGGPGTILYGKSSAVTQSADAITALVIDGDVNDWEKYPNATLTDGVLALLNQESLYGVLRDNAFNSEWAQAQLTVRIADAIYELRFTREAPRSVQIVQVAPTRRNLGVRAANIAFGDSLLEFRTAASNFGSIDALTFVRFVWADADGNALTTREIELTVAKVPQRDGFAHTGDAMPENAIPFYAAGALGTSRWSAIGRASSLTLSGGDTLTLELDVTFFAPSLPLDTSDLNFSAALRLQPVFTAGANTNNGWSNVLTASGLAIDNLRSDVALVSASTDWTRTIRYDDRLFFGLRFEVTLPEDLPQGLYVPLLDGFVQQGSESAAMPWRDNALFGQNSTGATQARLPLVLNVGKVENQWLPFVLMHDHPSDGSRGIIAQQDAGRYALSNRTRINSESYILRPGSYPLEPYLPNIMPNRYEISSAPLIPFLWPGGRVDARVTRPDGTVEDLGSQPVLQNRLSTDAVDEAARFGRQGVIDMFRATTLAPALTAYDFSAYGDYSIQMTTRLEDVWGNRYQGGGTYTLTIAEPMKLVSGVLPGTPFEIGDTLYLGARLMPALPADVTVTVRVYPLDGSDMIEQVISGSANRYGYFAPDDVFEITTAGEYTIDYTARYTDAQERLWAASLRSAGVIATDDHTVMARGMRGLAGYTPAANEPRPAWFNVRSYPPTGSAEPRLNYPYHAGDVAVYYPRSDSGIRPMLRVQDLDGRYIEWLGGVLSGGTLPDGRTVNAAANQDALPLLPILGGAESPYQPALVPERLVHQTYGYISAVRPAVSTRQFVYASESPTLPLGWDGDDPLNGQIGAGLSGDRVKDYVFLFGGVVMKNAELALNSITIYGALGIAGLDEGDVVGARVYPPFGEKTGASDAGPLLTVRGTEYDTFFHATGTQPGQALVRGEPIVIAGQVAPTLKSDVRVVITSPSGDVSTFSGQTNAIGYYFDPDAQIVADEVGMWRVQVIVSPATVTSAGAVLPPLPEGGVPGTIENTYPVYVTLADAAPLDWNRGGNIEDNVAGGSPINFAVTIPRGWTDFRAYRTLTMPGYVLDDGTLRAVSPTAYQYSPSQLALEFPNLEVEGRASGMAASDIVTITFAVEGINADGRRDMAVRTFTVAQDKLYSFEKE